MYYADSMAFLNLQMKAPVFDPHTRPLLSLAHLTSVPPAPMFNDFDAALGAHQVFVGMALSNPGTYHLQKSSDFNDELLGLLFGMQHPPDGLSSAQVRQLHDEGIQCMSLAYRGSTEYGGGYETTDGLTARGADLIRMMSDCGMILDLSHANHRTAMEALEFIKKENAIRVFASHSGSRVVYPHPRNLADEVAKGIAELAGYIGVPAITFMICPQGRDYLKEYVLHIEHLEHVCGLAFLGIGSDCNYVDMTMEAARAHYEDMIQNIVPGASGTYFPDRPPEFITHGTLLTEEIRTALEDAEYRQVQVAALCGSNFRAFLEDALPAD